MQHWKVIDLHWASKFCTGKRCFTKTDLIAARISFCKGKTTEITTVTWNRDQSIVGILSATADEMTGWLCSAAPPQWNSISLWQCGTCSPCNLALEMPSEYQAPAGSLPLPPPPKRWMLPGEHSTVNRQLEHFCCNEMIFLPYYFSPPVLCWAQCCKERYAVKKATSYNTVLPQKTSFSSCFS